MDRNAIYKLLGILHMLPKEKRWEVLYMTEGAKTFDRLRERKDIKI